MPAPPPLPVVLDLAPLPREQVGPFLLLGVDKLATKDDIEAAWAKRLIWARKNQTKIPLENINWARDALADLTKRAQADAASVNLDTTVRVIHGLQQRFADSQTGDVRSLLMNVEKPLANYSPEVETPTMEELRREIASPTMPEDVPGVQNLLVELVKEEIDPWDVGIG